MRIFRALSRALLALGLVAGGAQAAPYPNRAVNLIVPQSPGSVADIMARALAKSLAEELGQPVIVDNRAGASGIIGAQYVAKAAPDGYTLLVGSVSTHGLLSGTTASLSYDPIADFVPIVHVNDSPLAFVVHPASPYRTLEDLVQDARKRPGALTYASAGNGSGSRFTAELLRLAAGLDMLHVPYRSPMEAVAAVMAGQATVAVPSVPSTPGYIKAGSLRALAVTSQERAPMLPGVPTTAESGYPGVQFTSWTGLLAPKGTPDEIVLRVNAATNRVLQRPDVIKGIEDLGASVVGGTPQAFADLVAAEVKKWVEAARKAGITPQ